MRPGHLEKTETVGEGASWGHRGGGNVCATRATWLGKTGPGCKITEMGGQKLILWEAREGQRIPSQMLPPRWRVAGKLRLVELKWPELAGAAPYRQ